MNTDAHKSDGPHAPLTYKIVGCAMEVLNGLGHGLNEKPYENALMVEFGLRGISCAQQKRYAVIYKTVAVGDFIPDLVVDDAVIDRVTDLERGQMLNYLRITQLKVGLIINFKHAKLEWERIIL